MGTADCAILTYRFEPKMEIIPAIDIRGGRCVRLYQGDYDRETVFSQDPVDMACHWQSLGATRLHLVDLDGATRGEPVNIGIIEEIAREVSIPLQLGGGLRSLETVERVLNLGIERAVLGTVAIEEPELAGEACKRFGEAIVISIDARDGLVAARGWREKSQISAGELVERMAALGARRFVYTDIGRDGTLTEPNFDALFELMGKTSLPIIASGGISSIGQLKRLAELGVEGAIVGQALYTGHIDLREALEVL
jgi:phosphoribosylformimino-5-aminoimidazole carboxamide ribotide isomerase